MVEVWQEIASAEWLANVGLPLVVAVIALGVGTLLVRAQLAHDRELMRAQHRAEAARRLGWELRQIGEEVDARSPDDDGWWSLEDWPGWAESLAALRRGQIVLGKLDNLMSISREMLWRWHVGLVMCQRDGMTAEDHGCIMGDLLHEAAVRLRSAGDELVNWNGIGDPPVPEPSDMPTPVQDREGNRAWLNDVAAEYRAIRAKMDASPYPKQPPKLDVGRWIDLD